MNKDTLNTLLLVTPGGIEWQTAAGQADLARTFDRIPLHTSGFRVDNIDDQLRAVGFVLGEPLDDVFRACTPPAGWTLRPTEHAMWSDLVDARGAIRGAVFYKAAFYDRSAHVTLSARYRALPEYRVQGRDAYESGTRVVVRDACTNAVLFAGGDYTPARTLPVQVCSSARTEWHDERGVAVFAGGIQGPARGDYWILADPGTGNTRKLRRVVVPSSTPEELAAYNAAREEYFRVRQLDYAAEAQQTSVCTEWLAAHYPEYTNPLAYWDDAPAS